MYQTSAVWCYGGGQSVLSRSFIQSVFKDVPSAKTSRMGSVTILQPFTGDDGDLGLTFDEFSLRLSIYDADNYPCVSTSFT